MVVFDLIWFSAGVVLGSHVFVRQAWAHQKSSLRSLFAYAWVTASIWGLLARFFGNDPMADVCFVASFILVAFMIWFWHPLSGESLPKTIEAKPVNIYDLDADLSDTVLSKDRKLHREIFLQGSIYGYVTPWMHVLDCEMAKTDGLRDMAIKEGWVYDPDAEKKALKAKTEEAERNERMLYKHRAMTMGAGAGDVEKAGSKTLKEFVQKFGRQCVDCGRCRYKSDVSEAFTVESDAGVITTMYRCRNDCPTRVPKVQYSPGGITTPSKYEQLYRVDYESSGKASKAQAKLNTMIAEQRQREWEQHRYQRQMESLGRQMDRHKLDGLGYY